MLADEATPTSIDPGFGATAEAHIAMWVALCPQGYAQGL